MSLVQEALKRKSQEELSKAEEKNAQSTPPQNNDITPPPPPPPPAPPSTFPPLGDSAPPPPPPDRKKGGGIKALAIWLFIILLLGGLGFATYFLLAKYLAKDTDESAQTEQEEPQPEPTPTMRPLSERSTAYKLLKKTKDITDKEQRENLQVAHLMDDAKKQTTTQPAPEETPVVQSDFRLLPTPTPTAIPTITTEPDTAKHPLQQQAVTQQKATAPKPEPTSVPKTTATQQQVQSPIVRTEVEPQPIKWPKIRLSGVIAKKNSTDGLAVIDGEIVACGQEAEGCKLISVHDDGVVLEYEGEIRTLRVGGTMY